MGFRWLFQRKPEVYQSQPGGFVPIGLRYQGVFTFRRWGGRSSPNHSNLTVKQRKRVYAVPYKGCVPPDNFDEDHFTRETGGV